MPNPEQDELVKNDLAFVMLCAFNGVDPKDAPAEWRHHPNRSCATAWQRVADAASPIIERALLEEMREWNSAFTGMFEAGVRPDIPDTFLDRLAAFAKEKRNLDLSEG